MTYGYVEYSVMKNVSRSTTPRPIYIFGRRFNKLTILILFLLGVFMRKLWFSIKTDNVTFCHHLRKKIEGILQFRSRRTPVCTRHTSLFCILIFQLIFTVLLFTSA